MYNDVFGNNGSTLYCNCSWANRKTDLKSCGLQSFFPKSQRKRASRTEAEHIIPASWMLKRNNKPRQCVSDAKKQNISPRKYCLKHDVHFKQAHNDMVNLYPAVGQVNADRSNKPFVDQVKNATKTYGQCNISIGSRGIVPPANIKGDIARIAFYMAKHYGVTYSTRQKKLFDKWAQEDPVSLEEKKHHKKIYNAQGFGLIL